MTKKILWGAGILVILLSIYVIYGFMTHRKHSPPETINIKSGNTEITIDYCRPAKKGREIFGGLVPYDTYWRTGANEATFINFSQDVNFGGESVKAGKYRLYSVPGLEKWQIVLNTELEEWGAFEPDYDMDVLKVTVPSGKTNSVVEQFKIDLIENEDGVDLTLAWDETIVSVPINI
ncbi:MAG: DUF2911 domain-containing protein [Reichenbachiella sp.]